MPFKHTVMYRAFREITNFICDNGDKWDKFCTNTARSTRKAVKPLPLGPTPSTHKISKVKGRLAVKPLLRVNPHRVVLFPIQHANIWQMYKKAEASFWTAKEIDLSNNISDWDGLSTTEQHFISHVQAALQPLMVLSTKISAATSPHQKHHPKHNVSMGSKSQLRTFTANVLTPHRHVHQGQGPHQENALTLSN
jgi:hypothetical protein